MHLVIKSIFRAVDDLRIPGMLKLFLLCVTITALASALAISGGLYLADWMLASDIIPNEQEVGSGFLHGVMKAVIWMLAVVMTLAPVWLFFWSLMIFIASFFDEHIAELIEQHHYPEMALGQGPPFWPEFWQDVRFTLKVLLLNAGLLLLFIIPLFWPLFPILFPALNGYLLGKQFFRMAGGRHIGRKAADKLASQHRLKILLAGLLIVFAASLPLVNLVVPFWGVAMMVHLYHYIGKPTPQEVLPPASSI